MSTAVSDTLGSPHGARRIERHPLLGELPGAGPVTFTFEGRPVEARTGESIFPALIAAGIRVMRTMPKSREARGGYCLVGRCADCFVIVDGKPNVMACQTRVVESMDVRVQHHHGEWPDEAS